MLPSAGLRVTQLDDAQHPHTGADLIYLLNIKVLKNDTDDYAEIRNVMFSIITAAFDVWCCFSING